MKARLAIIVVTDAMRKRALAACGTLSASWQPHAGSACNQNGERIQSTRSQHAHDKWADVTGPLKVAVNAPRVNARDRLKLVSKLTDATRRTGT